MPAQVKDFWQFLKQNVFVVNVSIFPLTLKKISRYFPNLELLSFLTVLALPKLSRRGEASRICSVIRLDEDLLTAARYCMINLVLKMGNLF